MTNKALTNIRGASRSHKVFYLFILLFIGTLLVAVNSREVLAGHEPTRVVIDTDMGVDDATAVAWLLTQTKFPVEVRGITTVAGNTTVENATNNVLTILDVTGHTDTISVTIGASAPLSQTQSGTGALVHGPDGLWFAGLSNPHDLSGLPTDASTSICNNAAPDVKLIALGPLTNVARAVAECPTQMQQYAEIIILGGAKHGGNISPLAEFNFWADPEAADQVLRAGLMPIIIHRDTFDTFTVNQDDIDDLATDGTPAGQFLAAILQMYFNVNAGIIGATEASIPDVAAIMVAVNLEQFVKQQQPALVKMIPGIVGEPEPERLARGISVIGFDISEKIPMIANDYVLSQLAYRAFTEPGFDLQAELGLILMSEPDNATIVTDIHERAMHRLFMRYLTN